MEIIDYKLLDSGDEKKLEQFGSVVVIRPSCIAVWPKQHKRLWKKASAEYQRQGESGEWLYAQPIAKDWVVDLGPVRCHLKCTPFGHLGIFPEHMMFWPRLEQIISRYPSSCRVLNLFAYTGATSIFCAQLGATVYHVDASKSAVKWAQKNVEENGIEEKRIFWVIDDVFAFIRREIRRGKTYDVILLDPPTYGRGTNGEVFKIDRDIFSLLQLCSKLLADSASYVLLTSHTPGHTPAFLHFLALRAMPELETNGWTCGESFCGYGEQRLPSGVFAQWSL